MTISKEDMQRIKRHLDGDKMEALGAWMLDKNALNLALARIEELEEAETAAQRMYDHFIWWCRDRNQPAEVWAGGSVLLNAAQPLQLRRQVPESK